MKKIALQISPEAKSAYFSDYKQVALEELNYVLGDIPVEHFAIGPLEFFELEYHEALLENILRLSFTQGLYEINGDALKPLNLSPKFNLHEDFVFGSKFRGKTNERLTQLLINTGLATIGKDKTNELNLLDPMCGRATSLLWAARYGFKKAHGIELDPKALPDIHRNLKKWTKLHRQKHKLADGFIGNPNRQNLGKFLNFTVCDTTMRVVIGDARNTETLFKKEKFDLIISDLPYGVQHFTNDLTRNPLAVISECVLPWKNSLKKHGAIVLAFNANCPTRDALNACFTEQGFHLNHFAAEHRMSESIVRNVAIFQLK
jgi:16S rRNA G966 N2-methylase RsmD